MKIWFESLVNSSSGKTFSNGANCDIGLRALLIQVVVKQRQNPRMRRNGLRALLIQVVVKLSNMPLLHHIGLRALLIQVVVKLVFAFRMSLIRLRALLIQVVVKPLCLEPEQCTV